MRIGHNLGSIQKFGQQILIFRHTPILWHNNFPQQPKRYSKSTCRSALLGGVSLRVSCESSIPSLTRTTFDPTHFGLLEDKFVKLDKGNFA